MKKILAILLSLCLGTALVASEDVHELRWDWNKIDTNQLHFPSNFLWGAAICEYQTSGAEGCPNSNWAHWEKKAQLTPSGKVCDSWNLYREDIKILKKFGLNCYRFSIDWSKIEPCEGVIDRSALQHYAEMCDALLSEGIKPVVTLHHFVHPQWFEELGAFEKRKNISYFIRFCKLVFKALNDRVALWCTFNEPAIYAMQGYVRGVYPPGKSGYFGIRLAAKVLKNLLDAHVEVYHALKALPGGEKAKIGIVHQYLKFEPFHGKNNAFKLGLEQFVASQFDWVHQAVIEFFKTGKYKFYVTCVVNKFDTTQSAPAALRERRKESLDFIGINYYSHVFLKLQSDGSDIIYPAMRDYDIPTGMPFAVYAEGLYRAVKHVSELNLPIYITENGAPTPDDRCRDTWIKRYLYTVSKCLAEGYDIRGYIYWTLMDNYEWDMSDQQFGLCTVDATTQERIMRPGSAHFKQVVEKFSPKKGFFKRIVVGLKSVFSSIF